MKTIISTVLLLLICTCSFAQDRIEFISGSVVTGTIISYSNDAFIVRLDSGETKVAPGRNIRSIIFRADGFTASVAKSMPPSVTVKAHKKIKTEPYQAEDKRVIKEAGMMYIAVSVTVVNTGTNAVEVTWKSFKLADADGAQYPVEMSAIGTMNLMEDRILQPGEDTGGWIGFQIPLSTALSQKRVRFENKECMSAWAPVP